MEMGWRLPGICSRFYYRVLFTGLYTLLKIFLNIARLRERRHWKDYYQATPIHIVMQNADYLSKVYSLPNVLRRCRMLTSARGFSCFWVGGKLTSCSKHFICEPG